MVGISVPWSGRKSGVPPHAAPNQALVAPREARHLGIGRKLMQLGVVSQGVRVRKAQVPPDESRAHRSGANPRASPPGAVRSRGERGDRPRDGAPPWGAWWEADGFQCREGSRPGCVRARAQDTPGVCERGMAAEGERGHVGEPPVSVWQTRSGGPGDHRPWRARALPPGYAPVWETTHEGSRPGMGTRATSAAPGDGEAAVVAAHRTGEGRAGRPKRPPGGKAPSRSASAGRTQGRDAALTNPAHGRPVDGRARVALHGPQRLCVRNRMRAWRTSGSVGGPGGSPPALPGSRRSTAYARASLQLSGAAHCGRSASPKKEMPYEQYASAALAQPHTACQRSLLWHNV